MSQKKYPLYLSNIPNGKDKLKGESHSKIGNEICNIITNQSSNIKKQVIGLEGGWGSGKSNIVKFLEVESKLANENYYHFIYDSWSHQEDLNRRSILEELIDFLSTKNKNLIDDEWKTKENRLKGKTVNSKKSSFPEIKIFYILFFSSILLFSFLKEIYPFFESKDFFNYYNPGLKKFYIVFFLPIYIFLIAIEYLYYEYRSIKKKDIKNELDQNQIIGQLFSLIKGNEINSETIDFIVEKEPSNKNFREFLDFINERLETNEKTLILTIDNIDRLTKEKTKAIWSTINIFFAERSDKENYNNIWLIIPYDETKVIQAFKEDESIDNKNEIGKGLIEKTFAVKFRVTPPIPTNWEVLFDELIIESFGENFSKEKSIDFDYVKRIFDSYKKEIITPREIINFINELITIYSLHKDINFKYLALFIVSKDRILNEPISAILNQDYLNPDIKIIFNEDNLLEKNIASITFGVPIEMSEEILYSREIRDIIINGKIENLEKFKNNIVGFKNNFFKEFDKITFENISLENSEKIPQILKKIKELNLIEEQQLKETYWLNFKLKVLSHSANEKIHLKLNNVHKEICHFDINYGKEVLNKCIYEMTLKIRKDPKNNIVIENYIQNIHEIKLFLSENNLLNFYELKLNPIDEISTVTPENFLELVEKFPENFKSFNFYCEHEDIIEYFFTDNLIDIECLLNDVNQLITLEKKDALSLFKIVNQLKTEIENINSDNITNLDKYLNCLLKLSQQKPITGTKIPLNIINQNIDKFKIEDKTIFYNLICFSFLSIDEINSYQNILNIFTSNSEENIKDVSSQIEKFITFGDLILCTIDKNYDYPFISNVILDLCKNNYGVSTISITKILENFSKIENQTFKKNINNTKLFYANFNKWEDKIEKYVDKSNIQKIDLRILDYATVTNNRISQKLIKISNEFLKNIESEEIKSIIKNTNDFENQLFKKLNSKGKIEPDFKNNKLEPELISYLAEFAKGEIEINENNYSNLKELLKQTQLENHHKYFKMFSLQLKDNLSINQIHVKFFIDGLITYNLLGKANNLFLREFVKLYSFNNYIQNNNSYKKIIDVIANRNDSILQKLTWDKLKYYRTKPNLDIKNYAIKKGLNNK